MSAGANAHVYLGLISNVGGCYLFLNSSARSRDGGTNSATWKNDVGDLILSAKSSTHSIFLQEAAYRIYRNGAVNTRQSDGGGGISVPNSLMQQGSLTIGSYDSNYGFWAW